MKNFTGLHDKSNCNELFFNKSMNIFTTKGFPKKAPADQSNVWRLSF
ncbi:hypothetical protein CLU96_0945 [Chryseobacterium sp. 52]|nr:hypothetical protein CLU96_0945 [Chryseobacterium sp. 52]